MCLMPLSLVILFYTFQRTKAPVFCSRGNEISSMCITGNSDSFALSSIFTAKASGPSEFTPKARACLGFLLLIEDSAFLHCLLLFAIYFSINRLYCSCCLSWFLILKFVANYRGILGGAEVSSCRHTVFLVSPTLLTLQTTAVTEHRWILSLREPGTPMCCTMIFQSAMDQYLTMAL